CRSLTPTSAASRGWEAATPTPPSRQDWACLPTALERVSSPCEDSRQLLVAIGSVQGSAGAPTTEPGAGRLAHWQMCSASAATSLDTWSATAPMLGTSPTARETPGGRKGGQEHKAPEATV